MRMRKLCKLVKMGLLKIYVIFVYAFQRFMHSNVWRNKKLCGTNLCDLRLTHIIHINKSYAEICRFRVLWSPMCQALLAVIERCMVALKKYEYVPLRVYFRISLERGQMH